MNLCAPTTITLRRPSADADLIISRRDLIISRHDDAVTSSNNPTTCDVTDRQVSYSDPGETFNAQIHSTEVNTLSATRSWSSVKVIDHRQGH